MMVIYRENFDEIHVCESTFARPVREGNDLIVVADRLWLTGSHPVAIHGGVATGTLRFRNVVSSTRDISEYIEDPRRGGKGYFKPSEDVDDGPFDLTEDNIEVTLYEMSGRFANPHTSIGEWDIKAESFEFECEGVYDLKLTPEGCEYLNYRTIEDAIKQASAG